MHFIYLWFPTSETRTMAHLGSETPIYPPKILISHDLNICIFLNPNLDNFIRPWLKNMKTHIPVLCPSPINFWMIILGSEDMIRWTYSAKSDFPSYSRYWTRVSCSEASSITPSLCQVPETSNTWTNYQKSGINSTHNENKKKMFDLDNHGYVPNSEPTVHQKLISDSQNVIYHLFWTTNTLQCHHSIWKRL